MSGDSRSVYPVSLLACGHWQPTEPVATLTAPDLDSEDCRKCGQRVTRLYQWFPPKEADQGRVASHDGAWCPTCNLPQRHMRDFIAECDNGHRWDRRRPTDAGRVVTAPARESS